MAEIGDVIGNFTVLEVLKALSGKFIYKCACECGSLVAVTQSQLDDNRAKDCGCGTYAKPILTTYMFNKRVLERYDYTCLRCKSTKDPAVHHVNNSYKYRERRLDLNNGVVLCSSCHTEFHSVARYGKKNNNYVQLFEFINDTQEDMPDE